jgi:hypothetical protein
MGEFGEGWMLDDDDDEDVDRDGSSVGVVLG